MVSATRNTKVGALLAAVGVGCIYLGVRKDLFVLLILGLGFFILACGMIWRRLLPLGTVALSTAIGLSAIEGFLAVAPSPENSPSIQPKYPRKDYFRISDVGNLVAQAGAYEIVKRAPNDEIIYDVVVTTGEDGYRITPMGRAPASSRKLAFFGCSFTYGEGLNDADTLPAQVALAGKYSVKNYAFSGYGPHNALGIMEADKSAGGDINILITAPWHADRSACTLNWSLGPRYILENGVLRQDGLCQTPSKMQRLFDNWRLGRLVSTSLLAGKRQDAQIDLYIAIIEKIAAFSKERGQRFIVGFMDASPAWFRGSSTNASIKQQLTDKGIEVLDVSLPDTPKYYLHELDRHPSAFANGERAKLLIDALESGVSAKQ